MFQIYATVIGDIADQAEVELLARYLVAAVTDAGTVGCVVEITDLHQGRQLERFVVPLPVPKVN